MNDKFAVAKSWLVWVGFIVSFVMYQFFLSGSILKIDENAPKNLFFAKNDLTISLISVAVLLLATILRWFVIPKIQTFELKFNTFIASLAFSEMPLFFSIFLLSQNNYTLKLFFTLLSGICLLQMAPIHLKTHDEN